MFSSRIFCLLVPILYWAAIIKAETGEVDQIVGHSEINFEMPIRKLHVDVKTNFSDEINKKLDKTESEITALNENLMALQRQISQLTNSINADEGVKPATPTTNLINVSNIATKPAVRFDSNLNCIENCDIGQTLPADCGKAAEDGVYLLKSLKENDKPFGVFCDDGNWIIIHRRQNGQVNFRRNWYDYQHGFGNLSADYWLGLERIHALTSRGTHELIVKMVTFNDEESFARYATFSIDDEKAGYKLHVNNMTGDATDRLKDSNGAKFSTYDHDNDSVNINSAYDYDAWWYHDWYGPNPNGRYKNENSYRSMFWTQARPLKYFHMAIRRI